MFYGLAFVDQPVYLNLGALETQLSSKPWQHY